MCFKKKISYYGIRSHPRYPFGFALSWVNLTETKNPQKLLDFFLEKALAVNLKVLSVSENDEISKWLCLLINI